MHASAELCASCARFAPTLISLGVLFMGRGFVGLVLGYPPDPGGFEVGLILMHRYYCGLARINIRYEPQAVISANY